jgi:hypothetical protein
MHPTADTLLVIYLNLVGQRVRPGVRRYYISQEENYEF